MIIDWAVLGRVCGADEGLLRRLLEAFVIDGQKDVDDLGQALAGGDLKRVGDVAHRVYGAALTVGAADLARASRALDIASCAGQRERVAELGPRVLDQFAALTRTIAARRGAPAG
jgi:HPt (histidine-containing phosphotransfer) domain-containing protein